MSPVSKRVAFPWPALVLFFLSPVVGELLSGSAPPVEFFTPFGIVTLCLLYGGGALLVRELAFRWGTGWPGRLLLGAAYGIAEEALMAKSFFDPAWPDLGILGSYGRMYGVNWVWSLELTIYHCLFSICIPILLVELTFPRWRDQRWVRVPGLVVIAALFAADVVVGFFWITPFRPPLAHCLGAAAAVALLGAAARLVHLPDGPVSITPRSATGAPRVPGPRELPFFLLGAACTFLFFALNWFLPYTRFVPAAVTMALVAWLAAGFFLGLQELVRTFSWTAANQWALASGALAFFVLFSQFMEIDRSRPDDPRGMRIVGLVMAALLLAGYLKVRAERVEPPAFG
jgi:hypothetical protein